ncbi:hypothetical protein SK3146_05546 [Paenibacillus konkukensis]|uniref:Uncharacterized protein n=1 Tax=Paenibacillus konkukensis TaxID=2020716 RepID=A0ABY4RVJ4_9BACL|nr:hypothetical protein [Paenibacillus konkukensis]UQZ86253.1 hypothetical protein SK3146_05546 [Paenibacillus konkukensis]
MITVYTKAAELPCALGVHMVEGVDFVIVYQVYQEYLLAMQIAGNIGGEVIQVADGTIVVMTPNGTVSGSKQQ